MSADPLNELLQHLEDAHRKQGDLIAELRRSIALRRHFDLPMNSGKLRTHVSSTGVSTPAGFLKGTLFTGTFHVFNEAGKELATAPLSEVPEALLPPELRSKRRTLLRR